MNCFEFRRLMEIAPRGAGADAMAHALECARCAQSMKDALAFERKLAQAVDVPIPKRLEERILLRQSFRARWRLPAVRPVAWAWAACLSLAILVAAAGGGYLYKESHLKQELVALIEAADYALVSRTQLPDGEVADALRPVGLAIGEMPGRVSFAGRCLVKGNLSGHLVLREREQPVTVFLMPEEHTLRRVRFERGGWSGLLIPVGRHGTLAIMAAPGQPMDEMASRVLRTVRWDSA
jgi:hypothetical protein